MLIAALSTTAKTYKPPMSIDRGTNEEDAGHIYIYIYIYTHTHTYIHTYSGIFLSHKKNEIMPFTAT